MANVIAVPDKTSGLTYYFKSFASGTLMLTDRVENAAVVSDVDTPDLLRALQRKSYHNFEVRFTDQRVNWEKFRLRSDSMTTRPKVGKSKRQKKISPQKAGAVVRKYKKFLGS